MALQRNLFSIVEDRKIPYTAGAGGYIYTIRTVSATSRKVLDSEWIAEKPLLKRLVRYFVLDPWSLYMRT